MRDLLLVSAVLLSTVVALFRPFVGFLAYVCLGTLAPQSVTWGFSRTIPLSQIVAGGMFIGFLFSRENKSMPINREMVLLVLLFALFGLSTEYAIYKNLAWEKFVYVAKIFIAIFIGASLINSREKLHLLLYVIVFSIGFYAVKGGVFSIATAGGQMVWGPEGNYLYSNNAIGLAMGVNIPLAYYLIKTEDRPSLRYLLWAIVFFSVPAIICTFSRGAWLGMATAIGMIILKSRKKMLAVLLIVTLAPFAAILQDRIVSGRVTQRFDSLVNYKESDTANSRFWSWKFCGRVGVENPLHGGGFEFYSRETYSKYLPEFVNYYSHRGKLLTWSCHSVWFTILGEHGIPAITVWIGLLLSCFLTLRRIRSIGRENPEMNWLVHFSDMIQASLFAYMVAGTFLDAAYFELYYLIIMMVIAVEKIVKERIATASDGIIPVESEMEGSNLLVGKCPP